jgi:molybdopterin molybdotransferase
MKARPIVDDCFAPGGERLTHDDAVKLIQSRVGRVVGIEQVALEKAHNRILAKAVIAPRDIPAFTNSAVDGYAIAHASLKAGESRLKVVMRIAAGEESLGRLYPGEAARIFTGAALPEGADTCLMQEDVSTMGDEIIVAGAVKPGANRREAGEDRRAGEAVATEGCTLRPQEIAAIASTGQSYVTCFERLKVALVSTGNELVQPGEKPKSKGVYESNSFMLKGLLTSTGAKVEDFGTIGDERSAIEAMIDQAAKECHVILTTGGASRGEADHMVRTIREKGVLHGWQLAVKPGRPFAMGQVADRAVLALPGNPVAVFVTFLLYGLPVLARLQGKSWKPPQRYPLKAGFSFTGKKKGRREFWRGWVEDARDGPKVQKFARDGSGLITGLRQATGLIEIGEEISDVKEGDLVAFIPFAEFGVSPP